MSKFSDIVANETPTLIDVHAVWCGPCKMMPPILEEVKDQLGKNVRVLKIDIDKNQKLAQKHNIQGVPTLMVYQNGKVKWRQSGVVPAHEIVRIIKDLL